MRMIQLTGLWPLNIYSVARLGCHEYWAAEALAASDMFEEGQGPGIWTRRFGSREVPEAVPGTENIRIYSLSEFTRSDGVQQLVGLGLKTNELFASDLPLPERWALLTPENLVVFHSLDGTTWSSVNLGAIEKEDGPYPLSSYYGEQFVNPLEEDSLWNRPASVQNALMNATSPWKLARSSEDELSLFITTGNHLLEWDGWDARLTPLTQRTSALAVSNGNLYLAEGSRVSISASQGAIVYVDNNEGNLSRTSPKASDEFINYVQSGGDSVIRLDQGVLHQIAYVGNRWLVLFSEDWIDAAAEGATTQRLGMFWVDEIPTEPIEISTQSVEYLELANPQEHFDLGRRGAPLQGPYPPDPFSVLEAFGRAFIFQKLDFQDQGGWGSLAAMERSTMPVLEVLAKPSLADFNLTAAVPFGEGHILGTADGYILSARIAQNRVKPLEQVGSPVLKLMVEADSIYALTSTAIWFSNGGETWERVVELDEEALDDGFALKDAFLATGSRLFTIEGNGADSRVRIYDLSYNPIVPLEDDLFESLVITRIEQLGNVVMMFGQGNTYLAYNTVNFVTLDADNSLDGELVTACAVFEDKLWIGTQSGKLLKLEGVVWSVIANTERPIAALLPRENTVLIGFNDSEGTFAAWDGIALDSHQLHGDCVSRATVFLDPGGDPDFPCGTIILTDSGPEFRNCSEEGEEIWYSTPLGSDNGLLKVGEFIEEVTPAPVSENGSLLKARVFIGPSTADNDLTFYQPLEPGVRSRLLRPLSSYRLAVAHLPSELHKEYEFSFYKKQVEQG